MIAKGNPHNDGPFLARYLAASSKGNETAELAELRGFASDNIFDAFAMGQMLAEGTQCQNPFFHVQTRTPAGEDLTREQWTKVADRIERQLGFRGQPRAVAFHIKDGHKHMHLVWSRIDADTMHAIDPGLYKRKLKEVCRKLEKEMGLQQVRNERDSSEKSRPAGRGEYEQARRLKTDLKAIRETIHACVNLDATGATVQARLRAEGLILTRGDKRAFVVVDRQGGYHALGKKLTGLTAAEIRGRLADIDASSLPTVDQAKATQLERQLKIEEAKGMPEERAIGEEVRGIQREAEEQRQEAIAKEQERQQQAIADEENRKADVLKEEERRQQTIREEQQRQEALDQEEERQQEQFKEQADLQAQQIEIMRRQEQLRDEYKRDLDRRVAEARREMYGEREGGPRDAGYRYGQALADHYDIRDPYGSLARSAMAEYGAFLRDRENINRQMAKTDDPTAKARLDLQKRIEEAEYMAITSNRIAAQSEIIVGRENTEEALLHRRRAEDHLKIAAGLRKEYQELSRQPGQEKAAPAAEKQQEPLPKERKEEIVLSAKPAPGLMVEERTPGKPRGEARSLKDFVEAEPMPKKERDKPFTGAELRNNPAAQKEHYGRLLREQRRARALDQIGRDMKAGRNLSAEDVRSLNSDDFEKTKANGDDHIRQLVQQRERDRRHERER